MSWLVKRTKGAKGSPATTAPPSADAPSRTPQSKHDAQENQNAFAAQLRQARSRLSIPSGRALALKSIGNVLLQWGRAREAIPYLIEATRSANTDSSIAFNLAWAFLSCGDTIRAEEFARPTLDSGDVDVERVLLRAATLRTLGKQSDAFNSLRSVALLRPLEFEVHNQLAFVLAEAGHPEQAIESANAAIQIDSMRPMPHVSRARALHLLGRDSEADQAFRKALENEKSTGNSIDAYLGYGNFLRETARTGDALSLYEAVLPEKPSYAGAGDYALALLTSGELANAWERYEFRWINAALAPFRTPFEMPLWQGQDLKGRTVLLRDEQGVGDCIQFVRYAKHVRALGANVVMQARDSWRDIAMSVEGVDQFLTPQDPLPQFDFYCHLMSLPRVFGTSLETIPAEIPYIRANAERASRWSERLDGSAGLKVGLVWAGNPLHLRDRERSLDLIQLAPLLAVAGVKFFALQKGSRSEQAAEHSATNWTNLGPQLNDFSDTAAVIENLDIVICVDTSVAHLAGAMAKLVWLLLPKPADFRWMEDREESPWYPTMRLFRQQTQGNWMDVIERVKVALEQQVAACSALRTNKKPHPVLMPAFPSRWVAGVTKLSGHRPGFSAVAETRVGMVQYLPDEAEIGDAIAWYGEYLEPHVALLSKLVAPGSTVMEINAGIGLHALSLAKMVGPDGHLMLYETDTIRKRILGQNLEIHGIRHATIMRRQIGHVAEADSILTGSTDKPDRETLDDLQLERLDWLKINDAQFALEVLQAADETVWGLRPKLFLAADDEEHLDALLARAKELGYRCWVSEAPLYNPGNFNRREGDIFGGSVALALLAIPEEIDVDIDVGLVER